MSRVSSGMPPLSPADVGQAAVAGQAAVGAQAAAAGQVSSAVGGQATAAAGQIRESSDRQRQMAMQVEIEYRRMLVDMVRMGTESIQAGLKDYLGYKMWEEEWNYSRQGDAALSEMMKEMGRQKVDLPDPVAAFSSPPSPPSFSVEPPFAAAMTGGF